MAESDDHLTGPATTASVMDAASMITRNDLPIAQRMRAVFELKQLATEAAVDAICDGMHIMNDVAFGCSTI